MDKITELEEELKQSTKKYNDCEPENYSETIKLFLEKLRIIEKLSKLKKGKQEMKPAEKLVKREEMEVEKDIKLTEFILSEVEISNNKLYNIRATLEKIRDDIFGIEEEVNCGDDVKEKVLNGFKSEIYKSLKSQNTLINDIEIIINKLLTI